MEQPSSSAPPASSTCVNITTDASGPEESFLSSNGGSRKHHVSNKYDHDTQKAKEQFQQPLDSFADFDDDESMNDEDDDARIANLANMISPDTVDVSCEAYVQLDQNRSLRSPSLEILVPAHDHPTRRSNLVAATFNLVATIVGGGVLSLPLAFEKCGLVVGTLLMVLSAVVTDFSLYILCSCARRTGSTSYGAVARHAYGPGLELFTTLLLFVFLLFVLVAYMVLVRDIWTPIVLTLLYSNSFFGTNESTEDGPSHVVVHGNYNENQEGNIVLLVVLLLISPFLLRRDLHALRHNCYVGFASTSLLCFAILYRALERNLKDQNTTSSLTLFQSKVAYVPSNFSDALFAFPIITLSFLSSFNIIEVHGALINPTRQRVRYVIDGALASCFLLTYIFGVAGYLYAYDDTQGNILLNFDPRDKLVLLGRVGCGVTLCVAAAMVTLPCRESFLSLPVQYQKWRRTKEEERKAAAASSEEKTNDREAGETSPLLTQAARKEQGQRAMETTNPVEAAKHRKQSGEGNDHHHRPTVCENMIHVFTTFAIVTACYIGAVSAPGVAVVWSLCGSSMAFLVAFILPAACYIKLRGEKGQRQRLLYQQQQDGQQQVRRRQSRRNSVKKKRGESFLVADGNASSQQQNNQRSSSVVRHDCRMLASWVLLGFSVISAVACTAQTVIGMFFSSGAR